METQVNLPRLFIGSSSEGLGIAEYLQIALANHCDAIIWSQGIFGLSQGTLESLVAACKQFDFAALVLTPDDMVTKRGKRNRSARDNVLFELGLFMGSLGRERTFIVYCKDDQIDLPSDLAGVTAATFKRQENMRAAINPAAVAIRDVIKKLNKKGDSLGDTSSH
jgi:predicted nucleotide-binding protein